MHQRDGASGGAGCTSLSRARSAGIVRKNPISQSAALVVERLFAWIGRQAEATSQWRHTGVEKLRNGGDKLRWRERLG
jgi:hypothetical protein